MIALTMGANGAEIVTEKPERSRRDLRRCQRTRAVNRRRPWFAKAGTISRASARWLPGQAGNARCESSPNSVVARQALSTLESAADLPLAARTAYRFRQPTNSDRRAAWDNRLRGSNAEDLAAMADLFGRLAAEGPADPAAWYNRALCLAWSGDNLEAIAALDHVVSLEAGSAFERAVEAWTLAEILRQGGGAETLADDLRFACTIAWKPADTAGLLEEFPEIQRIPTPREPGARPG